MNKNVKRFFLVAATLTFLLSMISSSAYAADYGSDLSTTKEYVYDITYPNGTTLPDPANYNTVITVKDSTFDGIVDEKGNINVPSKEKMKEKYLQKFNKDPQKYKNSIKNIDSLVDQTINVIKDAKSKKATSSNLDLSSSEFMINGLFSSSYWHIAPYITEAVDGITYSTLWVGYDNYKSSVETKCTYNSTSTTEKSIGFSGDVEIKNNFSFSGTWTKTQSASVTTESLIPAWTVWDTRPYITWTRNTYFGAWTVETYNPLTGNTTYSTSSKTGSNVILKVSNTEAWSAINSSHSNTATSPLPPSGTPNVSW